VFGAKVMVEGLCERLVTDDDKGVQGGGFMMRLGSDGAASIMGSRRCRRGERESSVEEEKSNMKGVARVKTPTGKKRFM
jgi:hypothetical protein